MTHQAGPAAEPAHYHVSPPGPQGDAFLLISDYPPPWGRDSLYAVAEREVLLLAEPKEGRGWRKGQSETQDEREARIEAQRAKADEVHSRVEAGLESLSDSLAQGKSAQLLELLDAVSRFHRYSWGNTILIAFQCPDAEVVAGFTTWKEQGRYVRAGEKGIGILAPIPKKIRVETQDGGEEDTAETVSGRAVWGFKVVFVFDVKQTEGKPLPELATYRGDPAHYLTRLKDQVIAAGIVLDYKEDLGGALGLSRGGRIELLNGQTTAREFSALVHEFAHELLHPKIERREIPKRVKETEAEAVAYVVSRAIGLDPATASSDYIQLYRGDATTLAASLDRIQKTATHILCGLEEESPLSDFETGV